MLKYRETHLESSVGRTQTASGGFDNDTDLILESKTEYGINEYVHARINPHRKRMGHQE